MNKDLNRLLCDFNKLCILVQTFSDAYSYCVSEGKSVEHLIFLNSFIINRTIKIRNQLDLLSVKN